MASSDDEDTKAAIALSLAEAEPPVAANNSLKNSGIAGFTGLDRKAMEEERLARARKRRRSISSPFHSPHKAPRLEEKSVDLPSGARLNILSIPHKAPKLEERSIDLPSGARLNMLSMPPDHLQSPPTRPLASGASCSTTAGPSSLTYPTGVVKKTWALGHDRTGNDVKIGEVLEPTTLRTAVLSAYQWDAEWIMSKLKVPPNGGSTKCVFVMQGKEQRERDEIMEQTEYMRSFLRLCFPPMFGQSFCMHSKLMLLFHPTKLRVAIPTANLRNFDWGETGEMENSVFMIDLPRLANGPAKPEDLTIFGKELMFFLEKQGLDQDVRDGVLNFNFSATKGMAFVHTIGGVMSRLSGERTGFPGLGRAVRELGLQTRDLELDFAVSSIGSLNDEYLKGILAAAQGDDVITHAANAKAKAKANFFKKVDKTGPPMRSSIKDQFRIYFPTHETVRASTAGYAGTICISRDYWNNGKFPKDCMRDYRSVRTGLLSHSKILYARGKQRDEESGAVKDIAWAYVGSANMSESAWGKLVYDSAKKAWKVNGRNWECGVLLPVPAEKLVQNPPVLKLVKEKAPGEDSETESEDEGADYRLLEMDVFNELVDPPFTFPGQEYGKREPWFFKEHDH